LATQLIAEAGIHVLESATLRVVITPFGGRILSIHAPDRDGRRADVVLGFDTVSAMAQAGGSFNALLGRFANRIAEGRFTLDGQQYQLAQNDRGSTLHGGPQGFGRAVWDVVEAREAVLVLRHVSPDGDQGFPGEVTVTATYTLAGDTLQLVFAATTTRPTPINLSSHPYFNLAGQGDVLGHIVTIAADAYLPTDERQLPTGEKRPVAGTAFDFRTPRVIGTHLADPDPQLVLAGGYDHCFALRGGAELAFAARALDPTSGRMLELFTTQPGLQFYTGTTLNGTIVGSGGAYRKHSGVAFEAQGFPDAINQAGFPSCVLRPGEPFSATIAYRLTTAPS
jgi:aldose 1-epimerase